MTLGELTRSEKQPELEMTRKGHKQEYAILWILHPLHSKIPPASIVFCFNLQENKPYHTTLLL